MVRFTRSTDWITVARSPKVPTKARRRAKAVAASATVPAPGFETIRGVGDRRAAYESHGNLGALFDELIDALASSGDEFADANEDDLVLVPRWACHGLREALIDAIRRSPGVIMSKGSRHRHWLRRYSDMLVHWHRYALVQAILDSGAAKRGSLRRADPDAFDIVSQSLEGTFAAGEWRTIEASYKKVAKAIKNDRSQYYISESAHTQRDVYRERSRRSWCSSSPHLRL